MSADTRLLCLNALRLALADNSLRREAREECRLALQALLAESQQPGKETKQ